MTLTGFEKHFADYTMLLFILLAIDLSSAYWSTRYINSTSAIYLKIEIWDWTQWKPNTFLGIKKFFYGIQALIQIGDGKAYSNHFLHINK